MFADIGVPKSDNGNYLWIQYFYHYLNEKGRAGFVMASSATDAGSSEKLIREKLIRTGAVDCIVSVGNNFFYTRSLPCHLWFFDKGKREENKDKILMIDARNVFRQVTQTLRDFSDEQLEGLTALIKAYRGEDTQAIFSSNSWLKEHFENGKYEDIEGLCKIVSFDEIEENDWSLKPGRYVGYKIEIDEEFDYKARLTQIHMELESLHSDARDNMNKILGKENA